MLNIYMEEFTLSELGVFLGVVGGIMTSVLLTIQKSKCARSRRLLLHIIPAIVEALRC